MQAQNHELVCKKASTDGLISNRNNNTLNASSVSNRLEKLTIPSPTISITLPGIGSNITSLNYNFRNYL